MSCYVSLNNAVKRAENHHAVYEVKITFLSCM